MIDVATGARAVAMAARSAGERSERVIGAVLAGGTGSFLVERGVKPGALVVRPLTARLSNDQYLMFEGVAIEKQRNILDIIHLGA